MINWISIKEQLPPSFRVVLIYAPGHDGFMDFGYLRRTDSMKLKWRFMRGEESTDKVTHWAYTNEPGEDV